MGSGMLLDRNDETSRLEEAWARARAGTPGLAAVWGRRRVGKTFLLGHFARGKRAVFYGATQQSEPVELSRLLETITRDLGSHAADLGGGGFPSWEAALRFFIAMARDEPLLVVLDEVPYLTRSTPGFASIVQAVWDHVPPGTKLLLVLTGSAIGTIEEMLGPRGPLRGRPSLRLRLDPLDAVAARPFLPKLKPAAFLEAYAACGGYPLHLLAWDQTATTSTNLLRLAATPGGILLDDAIGILAEELSGPGGYHRVLASIGRGSSRISEIASDSDQRVEYPLEVLVRSGFVRKEVPIGAPRAARPLYEIADHYLAFWYSVLYSEFGQIDAGQGRAALERRKPQWERQLGRVFEEVARAHAVRMVQRGELPSDLLTGRWWASTGPQCEVDVLGLRGSATWMLGEARWQKRPLGRRELHQLMAKLQHVPHPVDDPLFVLWGRGGVDPAVVGEKVLGFGPEQMLDEPVSRRRR